MNWPAIRTRLIDAGFGALAVFALAEAIIQWPSKHALFALAIINATVLADRLLTRHWRLYRDAKRR